MTPDPGGDDQSPEQTETDGPGTPTFEDDEGKPLCGVPKKTSDGRCSHPVPNGNCPTHGDEDDRIDAIRDGETVVRDGIGSGDPNHTKGDGAAPEGNKNAMTHGVHAAQSDPWGVLDYLRKEEPRAYSQVVRWFWNDAQAAPFPIYVGDEEPDIPDDPMSEDGIPGIDAERLTANAADLLLTALDRGIIHRATLDQLSNGLATTQQRQDSDGNFREVIDENPVNLPKNRMRREARAQRKDLGRLEFSPDAVAAEGSQDMAAAAKRVAQRRDQEAGQDAAEATGGD